MVNPSSKFLRGANTAGLDGAEQLPDETAVLMAVGKPTTAAVTVMTLASDLRTTPGAIGQVVDQLLRDGLVVSQNNSLALTKTGERALRYANVAKF